MRSRRKTRLLIQTGLLSVVVLSGCAKVGTFSGGDKDSIPPVLVKSNPPQRSVHFDGKKIELEFNEYLTLKNIQQEFLISPPLKNNPVTKLKGKSIEVELEDTLNQNTTYTLNFGNSITDYTEGNPVSNFEFVFSTGASIDSFTLKGKVYNATDLKPPKDPALVMLYTNLSDSAPYLEKPLYAGRTGKEGQFTLNNLRPDTFRVFVLADANNNMRFDLPDEQIAFSDSLLIFNPEFFRKKALTEKTDISLPDSAAKDSLATDSLPAKKEYALSMDLSLFKEKPRIQYITNSKRLDEKQILFTFNIPLVDSFSITLLDSLCNNPWSRLEASPKKDSLLYWIIDTCLLHRESLKLLVCHMDKDSSGLPFLKKDTMDLRYTPQEVTKKKKNQVIKPPTVSIRSNLSSSMPLDLFAPVVISSPLPIDGVDTSGLHLFHVVDTLLKPLKYVLVHDSLYPRVFYLKASWKEDEKYRCEILPRAFANIYGIPVDTMFVNFTTQKSDYYGKLIVTIDNATTPLILQLMNKDKLVRQMAVPPSSRQVMDWLLPGKYILRVVEDRNGNGKWDTGDYLLKQQPERVLFYKEEFDIRSNWDLEIEIDMSKVK